MIRPILPEQLAPTPAVIALQRIIVKLISNLPHVQYAVECVREHTV